MDFKNACAVIKKAGRGMAAEEDLASAILEGASPYGACAKYRDRVSRRAVGLLGLQTALERAAKRDPGAAFLLGIVSCPEGWYRI